MSMSKDALTVGQSRRTQEEMPSRSPYGRRNVCVLPKGLADLMDQRGVMTKCSAGKHRHYTRSVVTAAVGRGEMRWVDRHHNVATYTSEAAGTWQKARSGHVSAMQLRSGAPGRYVPASQRI